MEKKIGLTALISIVIGSQVGSGVFMLPQLLAPYGVFALIGWCISGFGALSLAMVFMGLVKRLPKTGGPHAYVQEAFGQSAAFFIGWTYWLVSSLSSATVIAATISYLTPIINIKSPYIFAAHEIFLLGIVTIINLRGVKSASFIEVALNVIKIITLLIIPVAGLYFFDSGNITFSTDIIDQQSPISLISQTAVLTLWAFIGVEAATTPAEAVKNPKYTIPTAILIGTCFVLALYLINSISFIGLTTPAELAATKTPYVLATQKIFGGNWHLIIAGFAALVCVSNLNAWILTSGQIALGVANDNLLPSAFKRKNRYDAPFFALLTTAIVIVIPILLTIDDDISKQVFAIIDLSVQASVLIYLFCCASFFKILQNEKKAWHHYENIITVIAILFCIAMVSSAQIKTVLFASLFFASGLPIYVFWLRKQPIFCRQHNQN